jgi:hypothetical protein
MISAAWVLPTSDKANFAHALTRPERVQASIHAVADVLHPVVVGLTNALYHRDSNDEDHDDHNRVLDSGWTVFGPQKPLNGFNNWGHCGSICKRGWLADNNTSLNVQRWCFDSRHVEHMPHNPIGKSIIRATCVA